MGLDTGDDPEMVKIDVKVTRQQKETIDRTWRERGYPSRSEFVRDVLRDATQPTLTPDALRELARGIEDAESGRTKGLRAAKAELDVDGSE